MDMVLTKDVTTQLIADAMSTGENHATSTTGIGYGEPMIYQNYLSHLVRIDDITWDAASGNSAISDDLFKDYYDLAVATQLEKLASFRYFEGKLKITIAVQGAPFAAGQYVICFEPYVTYPGSYSGVEHQTYPPNKCRSKIVPHIVIDPSKTDTYEIELACPTPAGIWYKEGYDSNVGYGSYRVRGIVFNQMKSGTSTAPSLRFAIYANMVDAKPGALVLTSDIVSEEQAKNALSDSVSAVAAAAGSVSSVPGIGPYATALSSIGGKVAGVMKYLGYSKPLERMQEHPILNRVFNNYSHFNGKNYAYGLGTDENNTIGVSDRYNGIGTADDLLVENLMKRPGLVQQFVIETSAASGSRVDSLPVRPFDAYLITANAYEMTPLHHMTAPFRYWHGEITYTFEIIASVFHRATLLFVYSPDKDLGSLDYDTALTALYSKVVHVSGNTSFDFTVPWRSHLPWLNNEPKPIAATYSPSHDNGMFVIYVVNPVVNNGSTDGIDVNVYVRSENMKVMGPYLPTAGETVLRLQSNIVQITADMAQKSLEEDYYLKFGGENLLTSTKKLASKMSVLMQREIPVGGQVFPLYPMFPGNADYIGDVEIPDIVDTYGVRWTWFNWYAMGYVGIRGSVNMSFAELYRETGTEPTNLGLVAQSLRPGADAFEMMSGAIDTPVYGSFCYSYKKIHNSIDVNHPHYYPGLFRPNFPIPNMQDLKEAVGVSPYGKLDVEEVVNVSVLHGLGDDATFCFYVGAPMMFFGGV